MRATFFFTLVLVTTTSAAAQPTAKLTLGIYTPNVEFGAATARLAYARSLAAAIGQATGAEVEAAAFANLGALVKANVDVAIVDGACVAANPGWRLLAIANVGGGATRSYALYTNSASDMQGLRGKKLAFVATGCNDAGFIDNAMLDSEVDGGFFAARTAKQDLTAAIAEVASYKTAHAVFAPAGAGKGLTKLFDTIAVPNPGLVVVNSKLAGPVIDKVGAAVLAYGGGGAIVGWLKPQRELYSALAARSARSTKQPLLATPEAVKLDAKDVLLDLPSLRDSGLVPVRHHFVRPSGARLE